MGGVGGAGVAVGGWIGRGSLGSTGWVLAFYDVQPDNNILIPAELEGETLNVYDVQGENNIFLFNAEHVPLR